MTLLTLLISFVFLFDVIVHIQAKILLYHLQISQANQTFTQTFSTAFNNFPIFSFFIEGGTIQNNQFSVTYDETITSITNSQIVINFYTYKQTSFSASESINIALLITDEGSTQFQIGIKVANISPVFSLIFPNLILVKDLNSHGMLEVYSMSYPMIYNQTLIMSTSSTLEIRIIKSPNNYQSNINFGYIYYTNNYIGDRVMAVFKQINQTIFNYMVPYQPFAITPSSSNVLFAFRQFDSITIPFLNCQKVEQFNYVTGSNPQMLIGYMFPTGSPATFNSDVFFFNNSFAGCPDSQFLFYIYLYETLPYSCIPCDPTCLKCSTYSRTNPALTNANSCIACVWLRYLNATSDGSGNCICLPGIEEINGVCQQCKQACLTFIPTYIQTTNTSNFLFQYSYGTVVELIPLENNLQIYVNDIQVDFDANQQQNSYYIINIALEDMLVCEGGPCTVYFFMTSPQSVVTSSSSAYLSNNNATVNIQNYIDYYSYVPKSLQSAFNILGIVIGMAFSGGYSSLVTILFELEQLIDAHRYIKLTLPVVFNQLLINMVYFRFLSILNLLPYQNSQRIRDVVPNDLDCIGPPKLLYYENGLNFYKNTITAFISVGAILAINFVLYQLFRLIPFKVSHKLAKKISTRKFITVHDTLEQLQLPCIYFALEQLQVTLLHPDLIWIYILTICTTIAIIAFPFMIILYVYSHREDKSKIDIYEDLLQDNSMSQKVTYIYYVFNYYRKILFAMCLLSIIPGLVQIYLLIIVNSLHLAFQVYLVVARTYKSKMKIVIRFTNDFCIIAIEIMILLYNLNDYPKDVMINIGMACLYLTLVSTLMGILDVFVKIADTCLQQIRSKKKEEDVKSMEKLKIMKQFKNQIKCNIGEELQERPKDPKEIKFLQDKQLMENTFNKDNQSQNISVHLSDKVSNAEGIDLVFIDDDWVETYPYEAPNFRPKLNKQIGKLVKEEQNKNIFVDVYQIPEDIGKQARKVNQKRLKKQKNKYEPDENQVKHVEVNEIHHAKLKETKEMNKAGSLVVTVHKPESDSHSDSSSISDIISQQ